MHDRGKILHRVFVIRPDGEVIATDEGEKNSDSWLGSIHGHFAIANFLLVATDGGIIRVETHQNRIVKTREFPDTEPFVSQDSQLFATGEGLFVVDTQSIRLLHLN
jgi:H/ACA ribonucleoprotein complex subunit 3